MLARMFRTARHEPAPAGTSRHDCPSRASSEGPSGALPVIGGFPPQLPHTGHMHDGSRAEFPQAAAPGRRQPPRDAHPIRRSGRSLLTSGRCQRAPLAQLAEQRTLNPRVRGSSPWRRTCDDLGFYDPRSFFCAPGLSRFPTRARSLLARWTAVAAGSARPVSADWSRPEKPGAPVATVARVRDHLRRPLPGRRKLLARTAGNTFSETDPPPGGWPAVPSWPLRSPPGSQPATAGCCGCCWSTAC
jgi:hypothetical protein